MSLTPDTINTIKRNAGKLPPEQIARACGVSLGLVERIAREQGFDLRLPVARHEERHVRNLSLRVAPAGASNLVTLHVRLDRADLEEIVDASAAFGLSRNEAVRRLVGNACDRGIVADLVRLPPPMREAGE